MGTTEVGTTVSLTFAVKNTGTANLTGWAATIDGPDAAFFNVSTSPAAPVVPGAARR